MEKIEKFLKFFTSFIIEVVNIVFLAVCLIPVIICWYFDFVNIRNINELLFGNGKDLERILRLDAFTKKHMEKDDVLFNEHYLNCLLIKDLIIFKRLSLIPLMIILTVVIVF